MQTFDTQVPFGGGALAGKLEIGGFKFKKTLQNPPELMLEGEIQKLTSWAKKLAQALPRVTVFHLAIIDTASKLEACIFFVADKRTAWW